MVLNLIGKFGNTWGAEWMIKKGFEQLGYEVNALELKHGYSILRNIKIGVLTIVMQGYGMQPKLIESIRRLSKNAVVLWHAEVMSPGTEITDDVVQAKYNQLKQNGYTFDAIGHNCHCCLDLIRCASIIGGPETRVFWAPNNGVDAAVHRRIEGVDKKYAIGSYGYLSPRRIELIRSLNLQGIDIEYRQPEDGCFGEELMRFINQCHTILNFHYSESPNTECRLYEAMGCGVPVISEPISMPELFPVNDTNLMVFSNADELLKCAECVMSYANTQPGHLAYLGKEAMTWLHANASYAQRCQNFLERLKEAVKC